MICAVRRRLFLLLPLAAAGWLTPLRLLSEELVAGVKRLGVVHIGSPTTNPRLVTAFFNRLRELGWAEGRNLKVESRWSEGKNDQLGKLMAEVVAADVDVLLTYSTPGAVAAKQATARIPIVVAVMGDPVATGLASSLARPGGNLTGLSQGFGQGFSGKWLQLLRESVPRLKTVAVMLNPDTALAAPLKQELEATAPALGIRLKVLEARSADSFVSVVQQAHEAAQALLVLPDPITYQHRVLLTALALKHRLPSIYANLEFVDAGGLLAYGVDFVDFFRRASEYVDKILRGASPAELPIEEPTQFRLAVNLKTATTLGLHIPDTILVQADELVR
jgi:putative tryptophan/tyrosine transport system substrate-binding protein